MSKTVLFQATQLSICTQFKMSKTVLFQTIQFSIRIQFSSVRTLSGATTTSQTELGSDGHKELLHIPQSFSITGALPSDWLVSYRGHSFGESYHYAETRLVYFSAPADYEAPVLMPSEVWSTPLLLLLSSVLTEVRVPVRVPSIE